MTQAMLQQLISGASNANADNPYNVPVTLIQNNGVAALELSGKSRRVINVVNQPAGGGDQDACTMGEGANIGLHVGASHDNHRLEQAVE